MTRIVPWRFGVDTNDYVWEPSELPPGVSFIGRYLRTDGWVDERNGHSPLLLRSEVFWCKERHLDLLSIWENGKSEEVRGGYDRGRQSASAAVELQADRGGGGQPIFASVDFTPTQEERDAVVDYFQAWGDTIGKARVGVYGPHGVVDLLWRNGLIRYAIQSTLGEWTDKIHPFSTSVQYLNTDEGGDDYGAKAYLAYQRARAADFGQWRAR